MAAFTEANVKNKMLNVSVVTEIVGKKEKRKTSNSS